MPCIASRQRQRGAVIVTAALTLLFLLGFMGIALDFGRLFIVKTELQTAMDSCALAAAGELDGQSTALTRATSAGLTAGNLNNVNLQSSNWNDQGKIVSADITFKDSDYGVTTVPANAKYAQCQHTQGGTKMWLLQALGAFSGDTATYPAARSVAALAVATRASAQTACMLPIGICVKAGGYKQGEWVEAALNNDEALNGQFRWLDFGTKGGGNSQISDLLTGSGQCNLPGTNTEVRSKSGNNGGAAEGYNTRFGIYKKGGTITLPKSGVPDLTGYAWYSESSPSPVSSIYNKAIDGYAVKRQENAPYQSDAVSGLNTAGDAKDKVFLQNNGGSRRVVTLPVVDCAALSDSDPIKIQSVACILLLHPISQSGGGSGSGSGSLKTVKMWVEYIGEANTSNSPCVTYGLSGGVGGPLVPVLVR